MAYPVYTGPDFSGCALDAQTITKSDSTVFTPAYRALYVTTAGDVKVDTAAGTAITFTLPANFLLPLAVTKVYSTGTTATGIIGLR